MAETTAEIWKDVPGYEDIYQASTYGRIRSVRRVIKYADGRNRPDPGRILLPGKAGRERNYAFVNLSKNGVKSNRHVHDLVLLTFVGPKPRGLTARHGVFGTSDNSLSNLSYGTPSQNQMDRRRDGTGNNKPVRRSDGKVYDSVTEAAKDSGIGQPCVSMALHGKRQTAGGFAWGFIKKKLKERERE